MLRDILFYMVVFLSNIIQGITGFAGTILAMPFSIRLEGYDTARPILNTLGLLAGIVFAMSGRKYIDKNELKKVVITMAAGIFAGTLIREELEGHKAVLMLILGIFVIIVGARGLLKDEEEHYGCLEKLRHRCLSNNSCGSLEKEHVSKCRIGSIIILLAAGIIHGIFVSGGPLLISYLSRRVKAKASFRSTISAVWVFLNGIIFISDLFEGNYSIHTVRLQFIAIPFLALGLYLGSKLYSKMSQRAFNILTDILLIAAGMALF